VQPTIANDTLFYGDNLPILREHIPAESVDLVCLYIRTSLGTGVVLCGLHLAFRDTYSTTLRV
jgi:hypothetical protein